MDAKIACLIVLLFSYSSTQIYASFHKIKHSGVNNLNSLVITEKSHGSRESLETEDNLSIKKYKVFLELLYPRKSLKFTPQKDAKEKNTEGNFHEKISHGEKRGKRDILEINASVINILTTATTSIQNARKPAYSQEFLSCIKIAIEAKHYTKFENGTVYVPNLTRYFNKENYIINNKHELLICQDFLLKYNEKERKYRNKSSAKKHHIISTSDQYLNPSTRKLQMTALVCSCLSAGFMFLFIVMFIFDEDLRTLPGSCVLSLCVAQLVAYACTFVQYYIKDEKRCRIIGMSMLYFFLASFFWMNVMAFDIFKTVRRSVVELRLCTGRSIKRQLSIYSLYAWGTPLAIALTSVSIHLTTSDERFKLIFQLSDCWFKRPQALWLYFAGPVLFLLGANFLSFAVVFYMLQKASKDKFHSSFRGRMDLKSRFVICLKISSVMGLSWMSGIVAELTGLEWLKYPYVILSALQGLFIFLSYAINVKTKRIVRGLFSRNRVSFPGSNDQTKTMRL